jgi:hypothetical protein
MIGKEPQQQPDQEAFSRFLKRGGRSPNAIKRCLRMVGTYQQYLAEECDGRRPQDASVEELEAFVDWLEGQGDASARTHLWALRYYYHFIDEEDMAAQAATLREWRIERTPFLLANFRGVNPEYAQALAAAGVRDVVQMLKVGATRASREALAGRTDVPYTAILEMVRLSDLARLPGVKAIRARLYVDAGVGSIEELAAWNPEELRTMLMAFVDATGFDGIAPLPKEASSAVAKAKRLPKLVQYGEG